MEMAILLIIFIVFPIMFLSIKVSRQFSLAVFTIVFLGIATAITITQGLSKNWLINILALGSILFLARAKLDISFGTTRWLNEKFSQQKHSTCEICGQKMTYHDTPKNAKQLLFGGFTCENCGEESNISINAIFSR